jgi:hypothetical protein
MIIISSDGTNPCKAHERPSIPAEYGEPRSGRPEGKVKFNIAKLEKNLEKLIKCGITCEDFWKLKFLF